MKASSLALSVADIAPGADDVAASIVMTGVVVPVATLMGAVPVTLVTVPVPALPAAAVPSWPFASITTVWVPVRVSTPRMPAMKVLFWPVAGVVLPS